MKQVGFIVCTLAAGGGLFWFFPLFRVVRTDAQGAKYEAAFDAADFAERFWQERLPAALDEAADITPLLAAFRDDPQMARQKFGRKRGVSRARLFMLRGRGTIASVDTNTVRVTLESEHSPRVLLQTGLLFGNAVRDATGLIDAGSFANSQHFNDISAALNLIVEERVIAHLRANASPGRQLQFVGCAQVQDDIDDLRSIAIIPLDVKFE